MAVSTEWQLAHDAALRYQEILVPVVLAPAARILVRHAAIAPGETVLDAGCGTGLVARLAAERAGPAGRVVAIDLNAGMIEVARALPPPQGAPVEWREARAEASGLPHASIDVAACAQTLQFIPDKAAALVEMRRVLRPGGRLAIACWAAMSRSPYFVALVAGIERHFGAAAAAGITAVFGLSDEARLAALLRDAGFRDVRVVTESFDLALGSLSEWVPRHLAATPLAAAFAAAPAGTRAAIVDNVAAALRCDGACRSPLATHIALGIAP